jgi:hypothetical protein
MLTTATEAGMDEQRTEEQRTTDEHVNVNGQQPAGDEPIATDGLVDAETALAREADLISERFPDEKPDDVQRRLHERFDELSEHATIRSHLVTVASSAVIGDLMAEGREFHAPAADAITDAEAATAVGDDERAAQEA